MVSMIAANLGLYCTNQSIPVPHDLTALFHSEDSDEFLRGWERRFEEFGPDKGYTNMVLEKYAVIDPPAGGLGSDGDVVVVGVRPFLDEDQSLHRAVVRRTARGFIGTTFPEDVFAGWLEKTGLPIPAPPVIKPLPKKSRQITAEEWAKAHPEEVEEARREALRWEQSPSSAPNYAGPGRTTGPSAPVSSIDAGLAESAPDSHTRNPRWAMLAVGLFLAAAIGGTWFARRR